MTPTLPHLVQLLAAIALLSFIWLVIVAFNTRLRWGFGVLLFSPISAIIYAVKYWDKAKAPFVIYFPTFVASLGLGLYLVGTMGAWDTLQTGFDAMEAVQHHMPDQKEAVAKFFIKSLALAEQSTATEKDRRALAVMQDYLDAAQSGFTQGKQQTIREEITAFLHRSDLTEQDRKTFEQLLHQLDTLVPQAPPAMGAQTKTDGPTQTLVEITHADMARNTANHAATSDTSTRVDAEHIPAPPADPRGPIPVSQAGRYLGSDIILVETDGAERRGRLVGVNNGMLEVETHYNMGTVSTYYLSSDIKSLTLSKP